MENPVQLDRISNLPWDVLDTILVHLPLRDAVRTCVLSRTWRYKWTSLSQFIIDDKCFHSPLSGKGRWEEIMKIIHQIQSNHGGAIEKFKLAAYCCPNHSDLDEWISFLARKGIKELVLQDFSHVKRFKLPASLFSCPQLSCLELYGCIIKLPSTFRGFSCLKSLCLTQVSILSQTLESLITNCPVLERLTLFDIDHLALIKIHNQSLRYLKIDSKFEDISLEDSPRLIDVNIGMIPMYGRTSTQQLEQGKPCNMIRVLGCLYGVNKLTLSGHFLEFLANINVPERLPTVLNLLSFLELKDMRFSRIKDVMVLFAILISSPNLGEVVISVSHSIEFTRPVVDFLKDQSLNDFFLNQLKVVRIRGISNSSAEREFLKLILAHSPALEALTLVTSRAESVSASLLLEAEAASEVVELHIIDLE